MGSPRGVFAQNFSGHLWSSSTPWSNPKSQGNPWHLLTLRHWPFALWPSLAICGPTSEAERSSLAPERGTLPVFRRIEYTPYSKQKALSFSSVKADTGAKAIVAGPHPRGSHDTHGWLFNSCPHSSSSGYHPFFLSCHALMKLWWC